MKNSEKRVLLFLVEGPSDEAAIGTIMKEYFKAEQVQFLVVHGDITVRDYVSTDKILSRINDLLNKVKSRYGYKNADFVRIIHLTDSDGVFIPDERVYQAHVDGIEYYEDRMETPSVKNTLDRNHRKKEILFKLRKTGKIGTIPYRIYYNSRNLEHVLFGKQKDFTNEEKEELSDGFAEQYEGRVNDFIKFISSPDVAAPGDYQETWKYMEEGLNSLRRATNMHYIFQEDR
ncbi:MAG: hypothetical protein QM657_02635 [Lacrimispora sp.]|uniref:hypothetical protein n=1 Tax=Lacrimispora sp. TaxID=2719234 RepID=UPI0039E60F3F